MLEFMIRFSPKSFLETFSECNDRTIADLPILPPHLVWQVRTSQGLTKIIHDTPKRSATIPKRGEKNVFVSGICTWPPSPGAAKSRSASATVGTVSVREKPSNLGWPVQR